MPAPERYGVIGHPIAHSLSPQIHALFAQQTRQSLLYEAFDVLPQDLAAWVPAFFGAGGRGLNVTVPHKQAVLPLVDRLSERAREAGAVNTLVAQADGSLLGENTDGAGFLRDLTVNLRVAVRGQRVLLLGAGGAARGLLPALLGLHPAALIIANRTPERARALAAAFASHPSIELAGSGFAQIPARVFDLIVNATAAQLQGALPPLSDSVVSPATVCYDLSYGPLETAFMRWARQRGAARAFSGLGMLVEQAAESFLLWRGMRPDTAAVRAALAG